MEILERNLINKMAQNTNPPANTVDFDLKFKELQYKKLLQEMEAEEEAKAEWKRKEAKRLAGVKKEVEYAQQAELERQIAQENCPHAAKDVSFVRGQRLGMSKDENGKMFNGFLAFCQICKKRYDSYESIPAHLRSDIDYFGGPKNY